MIKLHAGPPLQSVADSKQRKWIRKFNSPTPTLKLMLFDSDLCVLFCCKNKKNNKKLIKSVSPPINYACQLISQGVLIMLCPSLPTALKAHNMTATHFLGVHKNKSQLLQLRAEDGHVAKTHNEQDYFREVPAAMNKALNGQSFPN